MSYSGLLTTFICFRFSIYLFLPCVIGGQDQHCDKGGRGKRVGRAMPGSQGWVHECDCSVSEPQGKWPAVHQINRRKEFIWWSVRAGAGRVVSRGSQPHLSLGSIYSAVNGVLALRRPFGRSHPSSLHCLPRNYKISHVIQFHGALIWILSEFIAGVTAWTLLRTI